MVICILRISYMKGDIVKLKRDNVVSNLFMIGEMKKLLKRQALTLG